MDSVTQPPRVPGDDDRQHALGGVVLESSYMEHLLRAVYVALIGSKYAVVTAAGQNPAWLIEQCQALVDAHADLAEGDKVALRNALGGCSGTYKRRNRVVHDAWAPRPQGKTVTLQSRRRDSGIAVTARTVDELRRLADDLGMAADMLSQAAIAAFGDDCLQLENQLRLGLGHNMGADVG